MTSDGVECYVWGSNKHKQLCMNRKLHVYNPTIESLPTRKELNDATHKSHFPNYIDSQVVENSFPVQVAAGDGHSLVLTDEGVIFSFGKSLEGQLGLGNKDQSFGIIGGLLENEIVVSIAAGDLTSYAITASGKVYHW